MSIALQRTGCKGDDNDWRLEQSIFHVELVQTLVRRLLFGEAIQLRTAADLHVHTFHFRLLLHRCRGGAATEHTNAIDTLQSADFLCGIETTHDWKLNIHQHQMEATSLPFVDRNLTVHGCAPTDFETFHESLEKFQVNFVVFYNKHVDRRYRAIEE